MKLQLLGILFAITDPLAHPGRTDANGGHVDRSSGRYHYHNTGNRSAPPSSSYSARYGTRPERGNASKYPQSQTPPPAQSPASASEKIQIDSVLRGQLKRAAEGDVIAQYQLGERYLIGNGVPKDPAEARRWFESSANAGNLWASRKLNQWSNVIAEPKPTNSMEAEAEIRPLVESAQALQSRADSQLASLDFGAAATTFNRMLELHPNSSQ